jgi:hypothetical protein
VGEVSTQYNASRFTSESLIARFVTNRSEIENENDDENEIGGSPETYTGSKSKAGP